MSESPSPLPTSNPLPYNVTTPRACIGVFGIGDDHDKALFLNRRRVSNASLEAILPHAAGFDRLAPRQAMRVYTVMPSRLFSNWYKSPAADRPYYFHTSTFAKSSEVKEEVTKMLQGLGYNRRVIFVQTTPVPDTYDIRVRLTIV